MIFAREVSLSETHCSSSKLHWHCGLTGGNIADPAQRSRQFASIKLHLVKLLGFHVGISESCVYQVLSVMGGRGGHMRMRSSSDRESNLWWSTQATDKEAVCSLCSNLEILIDSFVVFHRDLQNAETWNTHICIITSMLCTWSLVWIQAFVQGAFLWQDGFFFPSCADSQGSHFTDWNISLCPVSTVKQAGEIRLFPLCGELDTLGIMLETTESALTWSSHPHGVNSWISHGNLWSRAVSNKTVGQIWV